MLSEENLQNTLDTLEEECAARTQRRRPIVFGGFHGAIRVISGYNTMTKPEYA
jgi:hypothetical protein